MNIDQCEATCQGVTRTQSDEAGFMPYGINSAPSSEIKRASAPNYFTGTKSVIQLEGKPNAVRQASAFLVNDTDLPAASVALIVLA